MQKKYKHITSSERDWIAKLKTMGKSIREISCFLERSPSSISREIKRNQSVKLGMKDYFPVSAHRKSRKRNIESHRRKRIQDWRILYYIKTKLQMQWSPEIISGRLPIDIPGKTISHETIYQWIYAEGREYIKYLAKKRYLRRNRRYSKKQKKGHIAKRIWIDERPKCIEERKEVGHWEVDTVGASNNSSTLLVAIERKCRYSKISKIKKNRSVYVKQAMVKAFRITPRHLIKTFTYDNGSENCGHNYVNYKLGSKSYFCRPFHSWEKGSVENTIGLIRRKYPKKTSFEHVTDKDVKKLEDWLNHRPKKCLGFLTPHEVYKKEKRCT